MENVVIDVPAKLGRIVVGMNKVLGEIPVTVKLRTGVKEGKNTAHKLMPRVADWGASCLTVRHYSSLFESFFTHIRQLHGRTRQQRYTRLADWDYIRQCIEAVRAQEEKEDRAWKLLSETPGNNSVLLKYATTHATVDRGTAHELRPRLFPFCCQISSIPE